jgi:hypothetical protein
MTPSQARDTLATAVSAALAATLPTLPVFYENADNPNLSSVGDAFLRVEFDFDNATQASMETRPLTRVDGEIGLWHFQKEGTGTKAMLARIDTLNDGLRHLTLSTLQLTTPRPDRKEDHDGWISQRWVIPFWFFQA